MTVLLVEDDIDDQYFFTNALNDIKNVKLFGIARNGKEAIERLRRATVLPSMIFMDINMPVMDGLECLEELANDPDINSVPVIMLSSSVEYREQAKLLGASGFIVKPSNSETLRQSLEEMIEAESTGIRTVHLAPAVHRPVYSNNFMT